MKTDTKLAVRLPDDLYEALQAASKALGKPMAAIIRDATRQSLGMLTEAEEGAR